MAQNTHKRSNRNGRGNFSTEDIQAGDLGKMFDKEPPAAIEAEESVLGAMMLDWTCIGDVIQLLTTPEDFYLPKHGAIFKAIVDTYNLRQSLDAVQLINTLRDQHMLEDVGGSAYLVGLVEAVPTAAHAMDYARIVKDKANLRRLIATSSKILKDAYETPEDAESLIDQAEQAMFVLRQSDRENEPTRLDRLVEETFEIMERHKENAFTGVPSGFLQLDEKLSGLQKGEMIIIAARPSMGKTAFALNIAENMAADDHVPIAVFSLEMGKQQLAQRMLCSRSGVDSQRVRRNMVRSDEIQKLQAAAAELSAAPIFIDDQPGISIMQLRAKARRLARQEGIQCIMIDYLQLMTCPGAESRQQEVSEISRGVKALARELSVPVVCLSQLNRSSESRESKKPMLSDLRESGSIEQDADVVMMLHREDYYKRNQANPELTNIAEVIVAKQRNGPTGIVPLHFHGSTMRFNNLAPGEYYDDGE